MKHGEKLVEQYTRTKEIEIEIKLQQDEKGQSNILIQRFIKQLTTISEYKMTLQIMTKETNKLFKQQSWYKDTPPYTIDDIYDELWKEKSRKR